MPVTEVTASAADAVALHPAPWSKPDLALIARLLDDEAKRLGRRLLVIDPMSGTGRTHTLDQNTICGDLEAEWAAARHPAVCADATRPPFRPHAFDAYITSCAFGNRMGDHYENRDTHKACKGEGCKDCRFTGIAPRRNYRAALGHPLHERNAGGVHWGPRYWAIQGEIWAAVPEYLRPGGLALVNTSNFVKDKQEVDTLGWHVRTLRAAGLTVEDLYAVPTRRFRNGTNREARVAHEHVIVLRNPA